MTTTDTRYKDPERQAGGAKYAAFMKRIARSYGRKALEGELDTSALEHLVEAREMIDQQIEQVVRALRTEEGGAYSWSEIGEALGITRAAAYKRYGGSEGDARKPGGQPSHLR